MTHSLGYCHATHSWNIQSFVKSHSWLCHSPVCHYSSFSWTLNSFVVVFPLYIIAPIFHSFLQPDDSELLLILLISWLVLGDDIIWGHQLPGPQLGMVAGHWYNYKGTYRYQIDGSNNLHSVPCKWPGYLFWKRDQEEKTFGVKQELV